MPPRSPVVKVGRIAGEFAKPRSSPTEKRGDKELPSYRGDIVNGIAFTEEARRPDPRRQIEAYRHAAATLNLLRAFAHGGYASLGRVHQWMLGYVKDSPPSKEYEELADRISEALNFMRACGLDPESHPELRTTDFYTSHEGAAARLRAGDDPPQFDLRRLVLHLGPHAVDRRPHPPAGRRPRRILPRHQESDRAEMRAVAHGRRADGADRPPQPGQRARPAHPHLPLRRQQGARPAAGARPRGQARGTERGVGVRPDARQHGDLDQRLQDPPLRRHPRRGEGLLRRAAAEGTFRAASISR